MYNFQKLNWSRELSYVEGEVEVVNPDHDALDYESQREKILKFWDVAIPQQGQFTINERESGILLII